MGIGNKLNELLKERNMTVTELSRRMFVNYAREWKNVFKDGKSHNTREMYYNIIEKHMIVLDGVKLQDIGRIHLRMVLNNAAGAVNDAINF